MKVSFGSLMAELEPEMTLTSEHLVISRFHAGHTAQVDCGITGGCHIEDEGV